MYFSSWPSSSVGTEYDFDIDPIARERTFCVYMRQLCVCGCLGMIYIQDDREREKGTIDIRDIISRVMLSRRV